MILKTPKIIDKIVTTKPIASAIPAIGKTIAPKIERSTMKKTAANIIPNIVLKSTLPLLILY